MKKTLIIIGIITGLILVNLFSINAFYNNYSGKQLYENKDFSGSLQRFGKLKNYVGEYNKGNANYRIGEQLLKNKNSQQDGFSPLLYWEQALQNYKNSMKLNYTSQAEYNYNFVKKKLEELKKKMQEEKKKQEQKNKQKQEKKQNSDKQKNENQEKSGDNKEEKQGENKENKSGGEQKKDSKSGEKKGEGSNKKGQNGKQGEESGKDGKTAGQQRVSTPGNRQISENAQKQLKAYEERLKQEQQQNAGNYGKVYRQENNSIFDNFDSFFGNDPFFDNSLLNRGSEKKDW